METDRLVETQPDLTGTVECTKLGIYWDGPCSGLASVKGEEGFSFLLLDDEWGENRLGRLWAVYRLTPEQLDAASRGDGHVDEPPEEQVAGWTTWVEGGMIE